MDDCLYALQPTIPNLTRSSLHRCLQRHGIGRLPDVEGDKQPKKKFKSYPIGYFHIDIAEVQTAEGKLYLFVGIDRTSKFAFVQLVESANRVTASSFLVALIAAVPYKIHTILTDNGIQFRFQPRHANGPTAQLVTHMFAMRCRENGIEHRFTKPNHPWTNGQVERMNRTIKDATVKRYHYDNHDQLRRHLDDFVGAYNFGRRLKTLKGLTPYEFICKCWTSDPQRFNINPIHHMPGLNTSIETTLWAAADKLRGNMDAAEYKHVALGLIFLNYISDRFDARRKQALADNDERDLVDDRDLYLSEGIFYVPDRARWTFLRANATSTKPTIGELIDQAMIDIEAENNSLKGVLTKNYARQELDQTKLGEVLTLFSNIEFSAGEKAQDLLGRVYEYFLGEFAKLEGKRGGQYYTAGCVVKLLVAMLEPFKGRVYDPCCGSGGMFVQSERFVEEHAGKNVDPRKARDQISIFGQESNATTWRLAKMNLAIRGIEANLGSKWGDTFHEDLHVGLKAKYVLANPPFNDSDWGGDKRKGDARWQYGTPPASNANFAWLQHIIHHLAPDGYAGVVLANGSLSSQQSGEGDIRRAMIEKNLVDCIVSLPGQLFSTTQIPVCLWFLTRDKSNGLVRDKTLRNRTGEILFIDARGLGTMQTRTLKVLTDEGENNDIDKIADTYHAWREVGGGYEDVPGFAKVASLKEVADQGFVLTPGRYVGTEAADEDVETFDTKMKRLSVALRNQMAEGVALDERILQALAGVGHGR